MSTKRKVWEEQNMIAAIEDVRNKKMGYLKAAKIYSVPRTTLFNLVASNQTPQEAVLRKLGRKPILSSELEEHLVQYLLVMESKFFGLTRRDVRTMAYQLAKANGLADAFSKHHEFAGKTWLRLFLARHKNTLSFRKATATSYNRTVGFCREKVKYFFDILQSEVDKHNIQPDRIFNVDETGLTVV